MFVKLAHVTAVLALIFGLWRAGIGIYVASIEPLEAREAARAAYIGSKTTGQAIDQGLYTFLFAVTLGTLAAIARKRAE